MEPGRLTYEAVEPLLVRSQVNGTVMDYVFRCPVSGAEVMACAPIPQQAPGAVPNPSGSLGRSLARGEAEDAAEGAANRIVPGVGALLEAANGLFRFGKGRASTRQAAQDNVVALREAEQVPRRMLVAAFTSVADQFSWDTANARWVKTPG